MHNLTHTINRLTQQLTSCSVDGTGAAAVAALSQQLAAVHLRRALVIRSASAGLDTAVCSALWSATPEQLPNDMELVRTGDFSSVAVQLAPYMRQYRSTATTATASIGGTSGGAQMSVRHTVRGVDTSDAFIDAVTRTGSSVNVAKAFTTVRALSVDDGMEAPIYSFISTDVLTSCDECTGESNHWISP
jgi:hypothetical protein